MKAVSAAVVLAAVLIGEGFLLSDNFRLGTHLLRSDSALRTMFHVS
jgi:hypothetical protein